MQVVKKLVAVHQHYKKTKNSVHLHGCDKRGKGPETASGNLNSDFNERVLLVCLVVLVQRPNQSTVL